MNKKCSIPFLYGNQFFDQCLPINGSLVCNTTDFVLDQCDITQSFFIYNSFNISIFSSESIFFEISSLKKFSYYKVSFSYFIFCDDIVFSNCFRTNDYFKLSIQFSTYFEIKSNDYFKRYNNSYLWIKESFLFKVGNFSDMTVSF